MTSIRKNMVLALVVGLVMGGVSFVSSAEEAAPSFRFDISNQTLSQALRSFGKVSKQEIIFTEELVNSPKTVSLRGEFTAVDALNRLLEGTGLTAKRASSGAIRIMKVSGEGAISLDGDPAVQMRVAMNKDATEGASSRSENKDSEEDDVSTNGIPEILVKEKRSLNTDIRRTEDAPQPYVVFEREQIERSMTSNLEDFLKTKLPMNTIERMASQNENAGNNSAVNLRGLGSNQTLILVNGQRMPSVNTGGNFGQPDINGIPLAAIERVEVLPSTASGIYGGGATGGVVNIILRQDYAGFEFQATYNNTFATDAPGYRFDGSGGFTLENGRTQILLAASHADSNPLLVRDRDFAGRTRALQLANNPGAFSTFPLPATGYTTNIRNAGANRNVNLVLDAAYGGTTLSSPYTSIPVGYAGPGSDVAAGLVANAGRYNLDLPQDINTANKSLISNPMVDAAFANLRRAFGKDVDVYVDLAWLVNHAHSVFALVPNFVRLPANSPNNPFTTDINAVFPATEISFPFQSKSETLRATGGAIVRLPYDWIAATDYVWSRSRSSTSYTNPAIGDPDGSGPGLSATSALANGTLDIMRDLNAFPLDYSPYVLPSPNDVFGPSHTDLRGMTLRFSGPLFRLQGGPLALSGFVERREEKASDTFEDVMNSSATADVFYSPRRAQTVRSFYLEARAPLFTKANARPFVRVLELQASVRRDEYETRAPSPTFAVVASRSAPLPSLTFSQNKVEAAETTVGVRYAPAEDLTLRASFGTGFLPASVSQIVPGAPDLATFEAIDPKRGGVPQTIGPVVRTMGGNPNVRAEESESLSAGLIFTPRLLPGLRISIDYTKIEKIDEIASIDGQQFLLLEDLFPGRITREPLTDDDRALDYTGGVITAVDFSLANIAVARLEAYDVQADYEKQTGWGNLHFYAIATRQTHLERRVLPDSQMVDSVGLRGGPLQWRGNAGLTWECDNWLLGWNVLYYDSYFAYEPHFGPDSIASVVLNQGSDRIPNQTYHDVFARYRFDGSSTVMSGILSNTEIRVGIQNVFDKVPPTFASMGGAAAYSAYGDPRLRRYSLSLLKSFGPR